MHKLGEEFLGEIDLRSVQSRRKVELILRCKVGRMTGRSCHVYERAVDLNLVSAIKWRDFGGRKTRLIFDNVKFIVGFVLRGIQRRVSVASGLASFV